MQLLKSYGAFVLIILFSVVAVAPLFHLGFFPMHDDTQIARVFVMSEALKDGQFPVRVVDYLGYNLGYPIFNFYAPFAYYLGAVTSFLGFSIITATKVMIGLGVILAGIFMYFLAREFWGKVGGVVAALFYIYAPYHSVNSYVRGAISELWAYAFIPLAAFGFYKLYEALAGKKKAPHIWKYLTVSALGFAGIILSHNLTALMVTPFLVALLIVLSVLLGRKGLLKKVPYLLLAFVLGLSLSAFYFLPALLEMKYTDIGSVLGGGSDFRNHFVCPIQFWYSPWGFGGSEPGCLDGISLQLGKPHILLTLLAFLVLPVLFKIKKNLAISSILAFVFLLMTIFLMLPISQFIWEALSPMEYFQFPWRFLVLAAFFMSFLAGSVIYAILEVGKSHLKRDILAPILLLGSVILILFFYAKLFVPQHYLNDPNDQVDLDTISFKVSQISDEYLPRDIILPKSENEVMTNKVEVLEGEAKVKILSEKSQRLAFRVDTSSGATLVIHKASFPFWQVFLNYKKVETKTVNGEIVISVPKGNTLGEVLFVSTPVEKIGNGITLISVLLLSTGIIAARKKRTRE